MEEKELVIVDTDVLIEFLDRSNLKVENRLLDIGITNICVSEISAAELFNGARDKKHLQTLKNFIDRSLLLPVNKEISNLHLSLVHSYSLSHRLSVQNALIAATSITLGIELYTLNTKDFKFIKGLKIL